MCPRCVSERPVSPWPDSALVLWLPITLVETVLADRAWVINRRAAEIAREASERFGGDGRERFILGSVDPGTRLPSLGHVAYDALEAAFAVQCRGLIAGGVDAILIETCQDPLQIGRAPV